MAEPSLDAARAAFRIDVAMSEVEIMAQIARLAATARDEAAAAARTRARSQVLVPTKITM